MTAAVAKSKKRAASTPLGQPAKVAKPKRPSLSALTCEPTKAPVVQAAIVEAVAPKASPAVPATPPAKAKARATAKPAASAKPQQTPEEEEEARVARAIAAIRTPRAWNSGFGDLVPFVAANALGRPVVVQHTDGSPTTRIEESVRGERLRGKTLVVVRRGPHYLGVRRRRLIDMPAYGDCFFHALLFAMGREHLSTSAVAGLRTFLADYVSQPSERESFAPFMAG